MKTYLCVVGILSMLVLVHCELPPEMNSKIDECLKEFELTKEALKTPDFEDQNIKCFAACVLKKDDRLSDGKVSVDKEVDAVSKYMPEKVDDSLKDTMTECVNKANEEKDECAVAGSLSKCVTENYGVPEL